MPTKPKPQKIYVTKLVVRGTGDFPFDMIRYDSCSPWDTKDAHTIMMCGTSAVAKVTLRRVSPNPTAPSIDRWRSFGWEVVEWDHLTDWSH